MKGNGMDAFTTWLSENSLIIIGMILTVITVRGTVKFDINQWINDRKKQQEQNFIALCPHHYLFSDGDGTKVGSHFISPPGTSAWQCQKCGHLTHDDLKMKIDTKYWAQNPGALEEQNNRMTKLAKKLGRL
jgi:Zn-finger protein